MGDVSAKPVPEPRPSRIEQAEPGIRRFLTGRPDRPIRRPSLFVISAAGIGMTIPTQHPIPAVVALVALMLLALTDHVVVEL